MSTAEHAAHSVGEGQADHFTPHILAEAEPQYFFASSSPPGSATLPLPSAFSSSSSSSTSASSSSAFTGSQASSCKPAGPKEEEEEKAVKYRPAYYHVTAQTCPSASLWLRLQLRLDEKKGNLGICLQGCASLPLDVDPFHTSPPPSSPPFQMVPLVLQLEHAMEETPSTVSIHLRADCKWCLEFWAGFKILVDLRTFTGISVTPKKSRFPYSSTYFDGAEPKPANLQWLFSSPSNMVCEPAAPGIVEGKLAAAANHSVQLEKMDGAAKVLKVVMKWQKAFLARGRRPRSTSTGEGGMGKTMRLSSSPPPVPKEEGGATASESSLLQGEGSAVEGKEEDE